MILALPTAETVTDLEVPDWTDTTNGLKLSQSKRTPRESKAAKKVGSVSLGFSVTPVYSLGILTQSRANWVELEKVAAVSDGHPAAVEARPWIRYWFL